MAFDINNFVIDRVIRGVMIDTGTGDVMFSINQITDPSLSVTTDSITATDAIGSIIAEMDRAKNAEFTASNSLFDLGLLASQSGTPKQIGSATEKILTPKWETLVYKTGDTTATLAEIPVGTVNAEIPYIFALKGDSTLGVKYALGATSSSTEFELDAATKTLTYPTGLTDGTEIFVMYEYMAENVVAVNSTAVDFPRAGKFVLEILGQDICSVSTKYHGFLVFPNAKLSANVDLTFTTEGNHPFTIRCMQGYCDRQKKLFSVIVPQA